MIIKRIYRKKDSKERIELNTDNVAHYTLRRVEDIETIRMFDKSREFLGEIRLTFDPVKDDISPEFPLYDDLPNDYRLFSVYIMNDEGKTLERFVQGLDYPIKENLIIVNKYKSKNTKIPKDK